VREEFEALTRVVASQDQYLMVKHRDGHKEHVPGYVGKTNGGLSFC